MNDNNLSNQIAQYLLINSEDVTSEELDPTMSLLHLLFAHAYKYEKQHYANFTFQLLQDKLSLEIKKIDKNKKETISLEHNVLDSIEVGWGLIQFVDQGFFESDELNEILEPFDKMVFLEVERFSRDSFSSKSIHDIFLLSVYLKDRMLFLKNDKLQYSVVKEYLLIAFFELITFINSLDKIDIKFIVLLKILFEETKNNKELGHFAKEGLQKLKSEILYKQASNLYNDYKSENDLKNCLLISLSFSNRIITEDKKIFLDNISKQVIIDMDRTYKSENIKSMFLIQRIIAFAFILDKDSLSINKQYLAFTVVKLIKQ